jgi:hypothetical protein
MYVTLPIFSFVFRFRFIVNALGQAEVERGATTHLLTAEKKTRTIKQKYNIFLLTPPPPPQSTEHHSLFAAILRRVPWSSFRIQVSILIISVNILNISRNSESENAAGL